MFTVTKLRSRRGIGAWLSVMVLLVATEGRAQDGHEQDGSAANGAAQNDSTKDNAQMRPLFELYGFAQADMIYDFNVNHPDWFDTARPSRLPAFDDEFGEDGHAYVSARQTRFGVRATLPTGGEPIRAVFEWDLFGVGRDAGHTTIRLRHAWGQWKEIGAGQTNSVFMDIDVFPNTVEYWGPSGMLFFRNVQVFWRPIDDGHSKATLSLENPGASGDQGIYADRIELAGIMPRFPMPDVAGEYRYGGSWGYVEGAGIVRYFRWDDLLDDDVELDGSDWGWGASLSSNIKAGSRDVFRLQAIYGEGIQNYFNDAPIDVGTEANGDPIQPVVGKALPIFGMSAYLDHAWNDEWTSAIGYSRVDVDNSDGQAADAFHTGQYASANLLWTPVPKVMMGGEFLWLRRDNNIDGFDAEDYRLQFSFKYNFDVSIGG